MVVYGKSTVKEFQHVFFLLSQIPSDQGPMALQMMKMITQQDWSTLMPAGMALTITNITRPFYTPLSAKPNQESQYSSIPAMTCVNFSHNNKDIFLFFVNAILASSLVQYQTVQRCFSLFFLCIWETWKTAYAAWKCAFSKSLSFVLNVLNENCLKAKTRVDKSFTRTFCCYIYGVVQRSLILSLI